MNQGKLEVVKQMARVNINILGISELKWTRMGKFNSDDHHFHFSLSCTGEGNGNPLQYSCLEYAREEGSLVGCRLWGGRVAHD